MKSRYDLHTHTTKSDGTCAPKELLRLAKAAGLQGLSITDHDTIDAYTDEVFHLAKELALQLFTGVEITSRHRRLNAHILGYGFDVNDRFFQIFLEDVRKKRMARNQQIFAYLQEYGIILGEKDLSFPGSAVTGRLHIAKILLDKGCVSSLQQAFDLYLDDRGKPWEKCPKVSTEEAIAAIHKASGKAVLAHPYFLREGKALKELLSMNFDGIEAHYGNMPYSQRKVWEEVGKNRGWIITGGSDFHGSIKPQVSLGASYSSDDTIKDLFFHGR